MSGLRMAVAGAGAAGVILAMVGWISDPARFYFAWLAALSAWLAWPLGSLALLLVHALTGGRWGDALRPALLRGVTTLPLLLPALVPFLLGLPALYPWVRAATPNAFYLDESFMLARVAAYVAIWFGLAALVVRAARRGEALRGLAPPGLMLLALTMTFAAVDLTMSLDPAYNSSIYGMAEIAGAGLLALAVSLVATVRRAPRGVLADESQILLALVILWAYLDFVQFLIVWQSDLPSEAGWYGARTAGLWGWIAGLIVALHFVLPFAILLLPRMRRSRVGIATICSALIAAELLRHWWLVLPAVPATPNWLDAACMAGLFGIATLVADLPPRGRLAIV